MSNRDEEDVELEKKNTEHDNYFYKNLSTGSGRTSKLSECMRSLDCEENGTRDTGNIPKARTQLQTPQHHILLI